MAVIINEQRMVEENMVRYKERVDSPLKRFTDNTFTPCNYWHIAADKSTMDKGWRDVHTQIGKDSPIRYHYIEGLPLVGIEPVTIQRQMQDHGIDGSFEADASTYGGTIEPFENDFFMIRYLDQPFIYRVTGVEYDNIVANLTYRIHYQLEYNNAERIDMLMNQTIKKFVCILENIGTEDRCIVELEDYTKMKQIEQMRDEIADSYKTLYYNNRYNCFLGDFQNGLKIYDPFMEIFINKHKLFHRRNQMDGLILLEQFSDQQREIKYQKSIYRSVELQSLEKFTTFPYVVTDTKGTNSTFAKWFDWGTVILDIPRIMPPTTPYHILSQMFVDTVKMNGPYASIHGELIQRFMRREDISPDEIRLDLHDVILNLYDSNIEVFFITPIILYILDQVVESRLKKDSIAENVPSVVVK